MKRIAVAITLTLSACASAPRSSVQKPADAASTNIDEAKVVPFPEGWIQPLDHRMICQSSWDEVWAVRVNHGVIETFVRTSREKRGDRLPFAFDPNEHETDADTTLKAPVRHVLKAQNGYLVGFDRGEFGGSIYWFSSDGQRRQQLWTGMSVAGLVDFAGGIVALIGGSDGAFDNGGLLKITPDLDVRPWTTFDVAPLAYFRESANSLIVAGTRDVVRIDGDGRITRIATTEGFLLPNSVAVDAHGVVYAGFPEGIRRWTPSENGTYLEQRFIHEHASNPRCGSPEVSPAK